jgi:hypothetical protein
MFKAMGKKLERVIVLGNPLPHSSEEISPL